MLWQGHFSLWSVTYAERFKKNFNNLKSKKEKNNEIKFLKFRSIFYAKIALFEHIFYLAYKLPIKK